MYCPNLTRLRVFGAEYPTQGDIVRVLAATIDRLQAAFVHRFGQLIEPHAPTNYHIDTEFLHHHAAIERQPEKIAWLHTIYG